jgi:microcystin-dependent protein
MSDPFVAEIRMFAGSFAPTGWALCDGQLMPISQNTALFSLVGTFYGGDGKSTFALPNLQGSAPMHAGQGPGLTDRVVGEQNGEQFVTLIQTEMPAHVHQFQGISTQGSSNDPGSNLYAAGHWVQGGKKGQMKTYDPSATANVTMNPQALSIAGGGLPHNNMMPYLTLTFIIALQGIFPPRS